MVRYAQRPWYTPLGFMNSAPISYPLILMAAITTALWPLRYYVSEYFERQKDGPHIAARRKAVMYYTEIENMHRRQAMMNQDSVQYENAPQRITATLTAEATKNGFPDMEKLYWYAHQRDVMRSEKLLEEVRALKEKIAVSK